jgi:hypothetical protein
MTILVSPVAMNMATTTGNRGRSTRRRSRFLSDLLGLGLILGALGWLLLFVLP